MFIDQTFNKKGALHIKCTPTIDIESMKNGLAIIGKSVDLFFKHMIMYMETVGVEPTSRDIAT
jgi:hypothetical protein